MNKEIYIKQCIEIINKYNLKRDEKAKLVEQVMDVTDEIDEHDLFSLGTPQEFVDEVLALNDINPEVRSFKSKRNITGGKIIIGLLFILFGLSFIIPTITWVLIITFMFTAFGLLALFRKSFVFALFWFVIAFLFANAQYGFITINLLPIVIAFILIAIGLRIVFSKTHGKKGRKETINYNDYYAYSSRKEFRQKRHDFKKEAQDIKRDARNVASQEYEDVKEETSKTNKKEVFYIDNTFSGNDTKFTNEEINYISVRNRFGGGTLDFTEYKFPLGNITIDVRNVFGGSDITVPDDVEVIGSSKSFVGGSSFPMDNVDNPRAKIYILSQNKFGGMSVQRKKDTL